MGPLADLRPGSEVKDYCAFYQLMQPIPPPQQRLRLIYGEGPGKADVAERGAPSPGPFCPGQEWP